MGHSAANGVVPAECDEEMQPPRVMDASRGRRSAKCRASRIIFATLIGIMVLSGSTAAELGSISEARPPLVQTLSGASSRSTASAHPGQPPVDNLGLFCLGISMIATARLLCRWID